MSACQQMWLGTRSESTGRTRGGRRQEHANNAVRTRPPFCQNSWIHQCIGGICSRPPHRRNTEGRAVAVAAPLDTDHLASGRRSGGATSAVGDSQSSFFSLPFLFFSLFSRMYRKLRPKPLVTTPFRLWVVAGHWIVLVMTCRTSSRNPSPSESSAMRCSNGPPSRLRMRSASSSLVSSIIFLKSRLLILNLDWYSK
jgi:hypothetical protein